MTAEKLKGILASAAVVAACVALAGLAFMFAGFAWRVGAALAGAVV